jgi:hypothetical protein
MGDSRRGSDDNGAIRKGVGSESAGAQLRTSSQTTATTGPREDNIRRTPDAHQPDCRSHGSWSMGITGRSSHITQHRPGAAPRCVDPLDVAPTAVSSATRRQRDDLPHAIHRPARSTGTGASSASRRRRSDAGCAALDDKGSSREGGTGTKAPVRSYDLAFTIDDLLTALQPRRR